MDWVKMQHVAMLNQQSGNVTWRVPVGATDCQDDNKSWNQMKITGLMSQLEHGNHRHDGHHGHHHGHQIKITGLQSQLEHCRHCHHGHHGHHLDSLSSDECEDYWFAVTAGAACHISWRLTLSPEQNLSLKYASTFDLIMNWVFYVSWCLFFLFGSKSWPDHKATIIMFLSLECVVSIVLARTWRLSICRRSPGKTALSTWCTCVKTSDQHWRRTHQKGDRQGGGVTSLQPDGKHLWNVHPWLPLLPDRLAVMLTLFLAATRTSIVLFAHLQHIKHYNEIKSFELCFAFVFFPNTFPSRSGVHTGYRWRFLVADSKDFSKRSSTRSLSSATCLQTLALTVLSTQFYI